jgi:DNA replication protein DnaC
MEGRVAKYFEKVADTPLVIVEDFGFSVLDGQQLLDFMELIEDRHGRKSTIITSQLPVKDWYGVLKKNATIADAIIDRIAKTAIHFELSGDSMRK